MRGGKRRAAWIGCPELLFIQTSFKNWWLNRFILANGSQQDAQVCTCRLDEELLTVGIELTLTSWDSKCSHWSTSQSGELWKSHASEVLPLVHLTISPVDLREPDFLLLWENTLHNRQNVLRIFVCVCEDNYSRKGQTASPRINKTKVMCISGGIPKCNARSKDLKEACCEFLFYPWITQLYGQYRPSGSCGWQ